MGTSQSSNGSPPGTPMVPPWVPDIPLPDKPNSGDGSDSRKDEDSPDQSNKPTQSKKPQIAPPARFGGARRNIGDYARSGDQSKMRKGLGKYVKKGYGGSKTATLRLGGTAQKASLLYNALSPTAENQYATESGPLHPNSLAGKTAYEVMDIIVETICPVDGTQDTEASRYSVKDALSEVLDQYPDADLNNLTEQQRDLALERFVAGDVFRRIDLDLGKNVRDNAPNYSAAASRLKEIRNYVRQTVSSSFKKIRSLGQVLSQKTVLGVVQNAIRETMEVFEGYAE